MRSVSDTEMFEPCCDRMRDSTSVDVEVLRDGLVNALFNTCSICEAEMSIAFCPWCGAKLQDQVRKISDD